MAFEDTLSSLREFNLRDLDFDNVGSWPMAIKVIIWVVLLTAVLAAGYYYHIQDMQVELAREQATEDKLKKDFEKKAFQAANLEAYRLQLKEMEESFGALISQLPSDTEVPGLLEDITNKGLMNGLQIKSIDLQKEKAREFYVELPISIKASGSYHDLGAFISGMAGLPRIVTLHNFKISAKKKNSNSLDMSIVAKTYRYKDDEDAET